MNVLSNQQSVTGTQSVIISRELSDASVLRDISLKLMDELVWVSLYFKNVYH